MFYWLIELSNTVPGFGIFRGVFNVFRYITFRTGGAMVTGGPELDATRPTTVGTALAQAAGRDQRA